MISQANRVSDHQSWKGSKLALRVFLLFRTISGCLLSACMCFRTCSAASFSVRYCMCGGTFSRKFIQNQSLSEQRVRKHRTFKGLARLRNVGLSVWVFLDGNAEFVVYINMLGRLVDVDKSAQRSQAVVLARPPRIVICRRKWCRIRNRSPCSTDCALRFDGSQDQAPVGLPSV